MNYKEPDQNQIDLMKKYSDICAQAIEMIMKCEQNIMLGHASSRMQESMMWFHSYVINGGRIDKESEKGN